MFDNAILQWLGEKQVHGAIVVLLSKLCCTPGYPIKQTLFCNSTHSDAVTPAFDLIDCRINLI